MPTEISVGCILIAFSEFEKIQRRGLWDWPDGSGWRVVSLEGVSVDQDAEATHSYVRAAPGRVFARLARRANNGTLVRGMHIEFTPAQALQMAQHLNESARAAIAADDPPEAKISAILTIIPLTPRL